MTFRIRDYEDGAVARLADGRIRSDRVGCGDPATRLTFLRGDGPFNLCADCSREAKRIGAPTR